jgi:membrane protein DedA with SNARE-associated domain
VPTALLTAVHVARRLRSHPAGYTAIALAAFTSWAGIPGPGEAALIAGGAFAARHRLDIVQVELYAFAGALVGGVVGWGVGWRIGAGIVGRPGPLYGLRRRGLRAGERFFERFGPFAVFLTPSWVAGIHRVPPVAFVIYNAIACAVWTAAYGLTTFFVGPRVAEWVGDIGTFATIALVVAVAVGSTLALVRSRRRRARRLADGSKTGS